MAVITISRQFGAGGKTLGKMVADELGYVFADSEIVTKIAQAANVSETWVENVEREAGGKLSRVITRMVSKGLVEKILKDERGYIDEEIYLDYLVVMIAQIAEEGKAVILGRGSQYILSDHPDAIHVLLVNEFENRVQYSMKQHDLPYNKAAQLVRYEDKRRASLFKKIGKSDYDRPDLYHLVLNTAEVDLTTGKDMVIKLVEAKEKKKITA